MKDLEKRIEIIEGKFNYTEKHYHCECGEVLLLVHEDYLDNSKQDLYSCVNCHNYYTLRLGKLKKLNK